MSNIFNRPTGGSPTIDTMLGESYEQILEVYKNLDKIKQFNENIKQEDIQEYLPVLDSIIKNLPVITETNNNLDSIKAAPEAAQDAKDTINNATSEGNKIISEAKEILKETKDSAAELNGTLEDLNVNMESVKICASNIDDIRTTAENIEPINIVADYLEDADASISAPIPDLGEVGSDTPDFSFTGKTPIEIIASYIEVLLEIYNNLEDLIKLADDNNIIKLLNLASRIEKALEETKEQIEELNKSIESFDKKVEDFKKFYEDIYKQLIQIKDDIEKRREEILKELDEYLKKVEDYVDEIKGYKEESVNALIKIREVYKLVSEALDKFRNKAISDIRLARDQAIRDIYLKIDEEIDRIDDTLLDKIQDAINNLDSKLDELVQEKIKEIEKIINNKLDDIDDYVNDKLDDLFKDLQDKADEISSNLDNKQNQIEDDLNNKKDEIIKEIEDIQNYVYRFKGTVNSFEDLKQYEATAKPGFVYNVEDEFGNNYAWTGEKWDSLGSAFVTDYGEIKE